MTETTPDLAVVLARGQSSRMGFPKGSALIPGSDRTFLGAIIELYRRRSWPCLVVTLADLVPFYRALLGEDRQVYWLGAGPEGDTARSLQLVQAHLQEIGWQYNRIWAHPVDLPLVQDATVAELYQAAQQKPGQVLRPSWEGTPGHPVVLPAGTLDQLLTGKPPLEGPMRTLLSGVPGLELTMLPVTDRGVIQDFDRPATGLEA